MRTNDPVLLSFANMLLDEAGLNPYVADAHTAAIEGSIGAIPRRLLVRDAVAVEARRILRTAGLAEALSTPTDQR